MDDRSNGKSGGISRREFIAGASALAVAAALPLKLRAEEPGAKVKVVLVRDENAVDKDGKPNAKIIGEMLDKGVNELLGVSKPVEGWKQLVKAEDIVGIKTNVWKNLFTPKELEEAVKKRLIESGVQEKNVLIDDRKAWETLADCTALVNVRPLRAHNWAGIGGCIKNPIMFTDKPAQYHPDMCADLARVWELPGVKGKVRLNILVVLTPQFHTTGPHHFDPKFTWQYKGIMFSKDPVAVDAVGVKLFEVQRKRHFGEDRPLTELAKHVRIADEKHKLGIADLAKIEMVKIGWDKDVLI
jgi:hypothetical protein